MSESLYDKIIDLEQKVKDLQIQITALSSTTPSEKSQQPVTVVGGEQDFSKIRPSDIRSGFANISGGPVVWNDTEMKAPPLGVGPSNPSIGYNKHSHSRFSGGALIKDVLEFIEYVWSTPSENKHSQGYWKKDIPPIATQLNTNGETVQKIGKLDLIFNPDRGHVDGIPVGDWGTKAYEIDVKKCYFVEYDPDTGEIAKDSKGVDKKSCLYNENQMKTSIIWDEEGKCWRFYAVYSTGTEDGA